MSFETPRVEGGGFRPTAEQLAVLEAGGYALVNPVEYIAPKTIEEFRDLNPNNFTMYFWFNGDHTPVPQHRNRYMFAGTPCFERLKLLYPDFVEGTRHLVQAFLAIDTDIKMHSGGDGELFTRAEHDAFYGRLIEPRFFTAWATMGQLIDETDSNYQQKLNYYPDTTPATAVYWVLTL